jgi:type II secretory pathway pseudopilin PulG
VEIVITLTILGILVGVALPTLSSIKREEEAREPVSELHRMVREVRTRAIAEQRPYQIAFDQRGFHAARFFNAYGESEEFDNLVTELQVLESQQEIAEASRQRGIDLNAGREPTAQEKAAEVAQKGMQFYESYEIPDNVRYSLQFWGETEWIDMQSGLFRRWVFQPSGMCEPLRIRVEAEGAFFEVEFHPLTGDVKREQSWVD